MPPIFGILNTNLHRPDPEVVSRINGAAKYIKLRRVEALEVAGGYMATAVIHEKPIVSGADTMTILRQWSIVADASLYKRSELMNRLDIENPTQVSEATLILKAYLKWGETCLQYLYGDFAFVVFNKQTGEVFCGRDPLGVRPLFYSLNNQSFIFGSELRYVVGYLPAKPPIRHDYLLDTLITVKTDQELTPYEGVYRLKPGHHLRCTGGETSTSRYWQADPDRKIRLKKENDYIQLFREKLVDAVKLRCTGVHSLGSELSGGLDSSAICGIAADITHHEKIPFTAFSNIFPLDTGIEFKDERELIGAMLQFKCMDWVGVDRLNLPIPELLEYSMGIQGCFIQQNYNIFNQGIYEAAGEKGIDMLLSGFGGDELVSARTSMPWNELISERQWRVIADELFYKGITAKSLLKPGLLAARYLYSLICRPKYKTGVFTPELLGRRFASLPLQPEAAARFNLQKMLEDKYKKPWQEVLAQRQYARIMQDHLPQRLEYCYTAAAQYGMEYRYPLLDLDLIETCLAFPPWVKQHHGINRYLFRQAIQGFVPEKIRQRDDKSVTTIPQTYNSLVNEREAILELINSCSGSAYLNEIFDLSRFPQWYERLVKLEKEDMNYLMPGAFYNYLMIMLYYR